MTNDHIWGLIRQVVTGNATDRQCLELENWMQEHPEHRQLVNEVQKIWDMSPDENFEVNIRQAWKQIHRQRLGENRSRNDNMKRVRVAIHDAKYSRSQGQWYYMVRVAALILVGLVGGYLMYYLLDSMSTQEARPLVMEQVITGIGEKARVSFSDGSKVTLNASGSLNFPREFEQSRREVYLEGEAYFQVAGDTRYPFIVHIRGVEVEVLGTKFNVQGWDVEDQVEVFVHEGQVAVHAVSHRDHKDSRVVLQSGYQTRVKGGGLPAEPYEVDVRNKLVWLHGGLHFENEPFSGVIRSLERRFNVQIIVEDEALLNVPFTSTFQYAELDEILNVIGAAMRITYTREGAVITFS